MNNYYCDYNKFLMSKTLFRTRKVQMSEEEKYQNEKIIQQMNQRVNFLKNPRFKESKRPIMFSDLIHRQSVVQGVEENDSSFRAFPQQVIFRDYLINNVYEISVRLTNVSNVLKRIKFMPPAKQEFSIGTIKYPNNETGFVAPGMSITIPVMFNPSSFAEFDDELTILTEESIFKVPLLARNEPPSLNLPSSLDCKSCWLGDELDVRFKVTNTGGQAGYRFYKGDQSMIENNDEYLQVGNFMIDPPEFFLHKNETKEIRVTFRPDKEGETVEQLTLECDNQTSASIKLIGRGNTVELGIAGLDDNNLEGLQDVEPIKKIFFHNAIPNQKSTRSLKIRNKTSVKVKYHWSIPASPYSITPSEGYFQPDEVMEFTVSLMSDSYYPLFETAQLILDDIPIEAIRNPPESIKQQMKFDESTSIRPSITYLEFDFASFSTLCDVAISPPFYIFPNALSLESVHKKMFSIKNPSQCDLKFEVQVMEQSPHTLTHCSNLRGQIAAGQTVQLELGMGSHIIGRKQRVVYKIDFDYANSQMIELMGDFEAAQIRVLDSMVNFGLVKTNSQKEIQIRVLNLSPVKALIDLRTESGSAKITCVPDVLEIPGSSEGKVSVIFNAFEPETYNDFFKVEVRGGLTTILELFAEVQAPSVSLNRVLLEVDKLYSGNTYVFDERAQDHIVLQNLGNIPTPFCWDTTNVDPNRYLVQFDPPKGVIAPKSNQVIKFSIKPKQGGILEEIFVCDVEGLEFPLGFEMKTTVLGLSVDYEMIEEEQAQVPARESHTSHSSSRRTPSQSPSRKSSYFKKSFMGKTGKSQRSKLMEDDEPLEPVLRTQKMEKLDFFNCTISKPRQVKFLVKNTSGIHTQFRFFMETYEANDDDQSVSAAEEAKSVNTKSIRFNESKVDGKSTNSRSIIKKGRITQDGRPTVLLTDRIEKTQNFTSVAGQQLNYQKKLEQDQRTYLSNNHGVAVVCQPKKGALPAYGSVVVTVTCFSDICGLFEDKLCCEIRGLETRQFPVTVEIKGSPVVITQNQLGIDYKGDIPSFDMGTYMRSSGLVSRDFRVTNTGPKDIELDWKCFNLGGEGGQKYFDIKITGPPLGSDKVCDVHFVPVEPPEAVDGPFDIHPKHERVRGRREKHFTVNFHTGHDGVYNAVLVAQPRLHNQTETIGSISLYIRAETLQPCLYLDKLTKEDNHHLIKFQKWTTGFNKRQEKRICLVNKLKSGFVCSLELEGPFKFVSTTTNSPQKYELSTAMQLKETGVQTTFSLVQNSHIEAVIRFEGPQPSDQVEWPMNYKVYKEGRLNVFYSNGDQQHFNLEGVLLRPYVILNTSGIDNVEGPQVLDFGVVHINNKLTQQIHLTNLSVVPAQWKLTYVKYPMKKNLVEQTMTKLDKEDMAKTDDASVFEFQSAEGTLQGPSTMVHTLPHASALPYVITLKEIYDLGIEPFKILINFRPKKNILYKSKYRISVQDGPSVEFILKGTGTYDENLEKK